LGTQQKKKKESRIKIKEKHIPAHFLHDKQSLDKGNKLIIRCFYCTVDIMLNQV